MLLLYVDQAHFSAGTEVLFVGGLQQLLFAIKNRYIFRKTFCILQNINIFYYKIKHLLMKLRNMTQAFYDKNIFVKTLFEALSKLIFSSAKSKFFANIMQTFAKFGHYTECLNVQCLSKIRKVFF